MRKSLLICSLIASQALVSCTYILNNLPGVYKIDVQQGNIIEQSQLDQLRPNMSKKQVQFILGSPMLDNVFHKNRWDYIYINQPSGQDKVQQQLSVFFNNDKVTGIKGDFKPNVNAGPKIAKEITVEVPKLDLDRTMCEKITTVFGLLGPDTPLRSSKPEPKPASTTDNLPL